MFKIGELAAAADVTPDTLRFYEREGLVAPTAKSGGGYRLYDEEALVRLRFIKQARDCGFTLGEIQKLLVLRNQSEACCGDVRKRAIEKKLQVEAKVKALKAMSKALDRLIADCANETHPINTCPILAALEKATASAMRLEHD